MEKSIIFFFVAVIASGIYVLSSAEERFDGLEVVNPDEYFKNGGSWSYDPLRGNSDGIREVNAEEYLKRRGSMIYDHLADPHAMGEDISNVENSD